MLTPSSDQQNFHRMRALMACVLCYVVMVHGLAAHQIGIGQITTDYNALCLSDSYPQARNDHSGNKTPTRDATAPCCLSFSASDLPHLAATIVAVDFPFMPAIHPAAEFWHPAHQDLIASRAMPRAPPYIG